VIPADWVAHACRVLGFGVAPKQPFLSKACKSSRSREALAGDQFPAEYTGDIFGAFHGSWNRVKRTGYKVVRVPFDHATGKARGEYEDFVTGFVTPEGKVWGRPVGIAVAKDGSLVISEDGQRHDLARKL
jgi:glucose/arabinose dehydrogenase